MGPSVKFVSPNKGLISKKKMGVNFFRVKNDQTRGGVRGGFGKRPYFFTFFFWTLPLWKSCWSKLKQDDDGDYNDYRDNDYHEIMILMLQETSSPEQILKMIHAITTKNIGSLCYHNTYKSLSSSSSSSSLSKQLRPRTLGKAY